MAGGFMPVFVAVICTTLLFNTTNAIFRQLTETCRTSAGLGICVQTDICCTAVGGTIGRTIGARLDTTIIEISSSKEAASDATGGVGSDKSADENLLPSARVARNASPIGQLSARAADLTAYPDQLQARDTPSAGIGCTYNGVCCVLPTFNDYDCSTCGLWGDGVRQKVTTPTAVTVPPGRTTTAPPRAKKIVPRIVGGTDAPRHRWCWQVGILDANGLVCGGAAIARNWVITAAHCVAGRFLDEIIVSFNMFDFVHSNPNEIVYYHNPGGAKLHPQYNPATYDNDIALLQVPDIPCGEPGVCTVCLGGPVTFQPITTLPPSTTPTTTTTTTTATPTTTYTYGANYFSAFGPTFDPKLTLTRIAGQISRGSGGVIISGNGSSVVQPNPYSNLVCVITGWGSTGVSPVAPVLQQSWQQIISNQQCEADYARLGVPEEKIDLPISSFCTRGLTLTESSCVGDGGSPLVCQSHTDHSWSLWGITILGSNMCMPGAENGPSIFMNVGYYIPWIQAAVHDELPTVDTTSGRNAYKIPGCGSNVFVPDDPVRGGCPVNLHASQLTGAAARSLLVTGGRGI